MSPAVRAALNHKPPAPPTSPQALPAGAAVHRRDGEEAAAALPAHERDLLQQGTTHGLGSGCLTGWAGWGVRPVDVWLPWFGGLVTSVSAPRQHALLATPLSLTHRPTITHPTPPSARR